MEHSETDASVVSGIKQEVKEKVKEKKMDGLDPNIVALLKDSKGTNEYDQTLRWLIVLGFLGRRGGLFGGNDVAGASAGATQAKLDCLQQGQQDAAAAAHNANITNLIRGNEMATQNSFNRIAAQLAECCCNLKSGQKDIVNAICTQTGLLTTAMTANTQRVIDSVDKHAERETQSKLLDCKAALSNANQTKEIALLIQQCCSNNGHHGHR